MNRLEIKTLGPLQVRLDGRRLDMGTRKQRALLTLLIINTRRVVSTDAIIAALWGPDAAPTHRQDVWVYVSRLRKVLGPVSDRLIRDNGGYVLNVEDDSIDSRRFEWLVDEGRQLISQDPAATSMVLAEALSMWSGRAFQEFDTEDFAASEVARLEESRLMALEMRIEADLAWMEPEHLIPEIEGLTTAHPLRTGFTSSLMLALYRRGNQADALRAYTKFASRLREDSGLEPPEQISILEEQILLDNPVLSPAVPGATAMIPESIASFVGRHAELAEVSSALDQHRLVTVTGPGGVGKSALALEAARRLTLRYDDVAFVDLTRAERSGDAMSAIAESLRTKIGTVDIVSILLGRIGDRRVLLLIDNCESVTTQAARAITTLLRGAAGLSVLATSRVILGIPGEHVIRLAALSTEPGDDAELLLMARIDNLPTAIRSTIDGDDVRHLCMKTEGMPLSIELATAQLGTWSAREVIEALEQPLDALVSPARDGPEHHRDMRANIAWSERLLPPLAQTLLTRLSIFQSSFAFDAVDPVVGIEPLSTATVRKEMRTLVDASLVTAHPGSQRRYSLLEPVRQYARQRLTDAGEADVIAHRHLTYFADRFQAVSHAIDFGADARVLERARPDDANLLAAIWWAIDAGETAAARRAAVSAIPFWRATTDISATLSTIDAVLGMSNCHDKTKAELLFRSAPFYWLNPAADVARDPVAELESVAQSLSDPEVSAWLLLRRADITVGHGDPDDVIDMYSRAFDSLQARGSSYAFSALHQLGWYQFWCWDRQVETRATIDRWIELCTSSLMQTEDALELSGWLSLAGEETDEAIEAFQAISVSYRHRSDHRMATLQQFPLAIASLQRSDIEESQRRIAIAVSACREAGAVRWLVNALMTKVHIEVALGNDADAIDDLLEVGASLLQGNAIEAVSAFAHTAAIVVSDNRPDVSAQLLGSSEAKAANHELSSLTLKLVAPAFERVVGNIEAPIRRALGSSRFESVWKRGAALDTNATVALGLDALESVKSER